MRFALFFAVIFTLVGYQPLLAQNAPAQQPAAEEGDEKPAKDGKSEEKPAPQDGDFIPGEEISEDYPIPLPSDI